MKRMAVIPGDGVGPEVVGESLRVLDFVTASVVVIVDDHVPDSYLPSVPGVSRSHSLDAPALCTSTEASVSSSMMSP
jgi:hypothetical protein